MRVGLCHCFEKVSVSALLDINTDNGIFSISVCMKVEKAKTKLCCTKQPCTCEQGLSNLVVIITKQECPHAGKAIWLARLHSEK